MDGSPKCEQVIDEPVLSTVSGPRGQPVISCVVRGYRQGIVLVTLRMVSNVPVQDVTCTQKVARYKSVLSGQAGVYGQHVAKAAPRGHKPENVTVLL